MRKIWSDNFKALYDQRGQQKYGIRLLAMWKLQAGLTIKSVCDLIGKTHKSIYGWIRLYETGGIDRLLSLGSGRGRKTRVKDSDSFKRNINLLHKKQNGGRIRCVDIKRMVSTKYGVEYSDSGIYYLLHKFRFSWITSRSKHPKSNTDVIQAFKQRFTTKVKEVLPKTVDIENVDIWFEDETRVGQQGSRTRIWTKTGTRPRVVKQQQFISFLELFVQVYVHVLA